MSKEKKKEENEDDEMDGLLDIPLLDEDEVKQSLGVVDDVDELLNSNNASYHSDESIDISSSLPNLPSSLVDIKIKESNKKRARDEDNKEDDSNREVEPKKKKTKRTLPSSILSSSSAKKSKKSVSNSYQSTSSTTNSTTNSTSNKAKKKTIAKKRKPAKKKERKFDNLNKKYDSDDESDTNASDADENGNLADFVVTNKKKIKEEQKKAIKEKLEKRKVSFDKIMDNVIIVISGIANPERSELRKKVIEMGGKYSPGWNNTCTHLICTFRGSDKYREAHRSGGKCVTKEWIYACYSNKFRVSENKYDFNAPYISSDDEEELELSDDSGTDFDEIDPDADYIPRKRRKKTEESDEDIENDSYNVSNSQQDIKHDTEIRKKESPKKTSSNFNHNYKNLINESLDKDPLLKKDYDSLKKSLENGETFEELVSKIITFCSEILDTRDSLDIYEEWDFSFAVPKLIRKSIRELSDKNELKKRLNEIQSSYIRIEKPVVEDKSKGDESEDELPSFLSDCVIFIHDSISNVKKRKRLERLIYTYGGEVVKLEDIPSVDVNTITHILVANDEFDTMTRFVPPSFVHGMNSSEDLKIVEEEWIVMCDKKQKKMNEKPFEV